MILDEIVERKKKDLQNKKFLSIEEYKKAAKAAPVKNSFYQALSKKELSIIGEIKKASPSKGIIKNDFFPLEIASEYEGAVDAISVLTEENYFLGNLSILKDVSQSNKLPLLRKDFIIDEREIYEAKISGASAVLLIVAILNEEKLKTFIQLTKSLNLDALVEVHDEEEVEKAIKAGADIIGINNRNLKDFSVSLETTKKLRKLIPENILVVSESGIHEVEHIKFLSQCNVNAILVGESFMRCEDIKVKAKEFKSNYNMEAL
jgi:indole-3-glycerol phosphate synthase